MAKKDDFMDTEDQQAVIMVTDEQGNESYYLEEMVIPMDNKNFAMLTELGKDGEETDDEEDNVIIARIEFNENGDPIYLDPTDEEFEKVKAAYEQIMDEMEDAEK